jgi:hypothetical protein
MTTVAANPAAPKSLMNRPGNSSNLVWSTAIRLPSF